MTACIDYYVSRARYDWVTVDEIMSGQHQGHIREEDRAEVVRRVVAAGLGPGAVSRLLSTNAVEARRLIRLAVG